MENARGLPTFRSTGDNGTKDPVEHMLCCKTIFIANYYRPQYWLTALLTTLRTVYINWATKKLVEAVPSLTWEKATDIFVQHFHAPNYKSVKKRKLFSIKVGDDETIQDFNNWFLNDVLEVYADDADNETTRELYIMSLPSKL